MLEFIKPILSDSLGITITSLDYQSLGGGSINQTYKVRVNHELLCFCKINQIEPFPALFEQEKNGLEKLAAQGIFRVPSVLLYFSNRQEQILILEWIESATITKKSWNCFGEKLARLHRVHSEFNGLETDNFMGALPQSNRETLNWTDFFIRERLEPQVKLAVDRKYLSHPEITAFENLYAHLANIFQEEKPSLLHGDLWNGNFMIAKDDEPVLIDPAIYFGHRSMDLAMTTLFGGFDQAFYDAYAYHFPFPANYREQWKICNLYPLLIHLNLFGNSYRPAILNTISQF